MGGAEVTVDYDIILPATVLDSHPGAAQHCAGPLLAAGAGRGHTVCLRNSSISHMLTLE